MTFDARSKERLEALGRTLPKKLPLPEPAAPAPASSRGVPSPPSAPRAGSPSATPRRPETLPPPGPPSAKASRPQDPRHALEREEDPAALFRALMAASPDGTVPPHHLERLRDLEALKRSTPPASPSPTAPAAIASSRRGTEKGAKGLAGKQRDRQGKKALDAADPSLYTAFAQLLLEEDGEV